MASVFRDRLSCMLCSLVFGLHLALGLLGICFISLRKNNPPPKTKWGARYIATCTIILSISSCCDCRFAHSLSYQINSYTVVCLVCHGSSLCVSAGIFRMRTTM